MTMRLLLLLLLVLFPVKSIFAESVEKLGITDKPNVPNVKGHTTAQIPAFQAHTGPTRKFPKEGPLVFELRELINLPFYFWPTTLLTYPVSFDDLTIYPDQLSLIRTDTNQQQPFQLTDLRLENGRLKSAMVHFLSDLPTGSTRRFELRITERRANNDLDKSASRMVQINKDNIVLDTGETKIRIPSSQEIKGEVPGPILQLGWKDRWFGTSRMISPKHRVLRIRTEQESSGPVFVQYRITYEFEGGGRYVASIRSIDGYEYFPFHERTEGIPSDEGVYFETTWTGFNPTHREGPNHPWVPVKYVPYGMDRNKKPPFSAHKWERIDDPIVSDRQGVWHAFSKEGELAFRLGPYGMRTTYVILTSSSFWDEHTNNAIGIIADHVDAWQDNYYAIWSSSDIQHVRYFYKDKILSWRWPVANGVRSTGIVGYDHNKDIQAVDRDQELYRKVDGGGYFLGLMGMTSHTQYLRNRFAPLNLNRVKDYVLDYAKDHKLVPQVFKSGSIKTGDDLLKKILSEALIRELPMHGSRTDSGFSAVHTRVIHNVLTDSYTRLYEQMNKEQKRRITAAYLMLAYQVAEDDFQPFRTMLGGNPNFMADVKGGIGFMVYLFPDHPKAREWADIYSKFVDVGMKYMIRPTVDEWDSKGGRWSENLGSYVWAALRPTLRAVSLLQNHYDGRNRVANPQTVELGDWLVNAVGAPTNPIARRGRDRTDILDTGNQQQAPTEKTEALRRVYPPQGAHASRRVPPRDLWLLGSLLRNYAPLKAEHMMYTARPTNSDFIQETDFWSSILFNSSDNRGTNPHLKSSKYTGYGITLRAAVDTPEELSIHLQQIDNGPNYRWGMPGEGSNGNIYFYAAGKAYTHNGSEDAGDRRAAATDYNTNFAVWKDNGFRSIGKNFLTEPMYDLGSGQYAEIRARKDRYSFAYPQYLSRSLLLAGSDYFAIYDDTSANAVRWRFSWVTAVNDPMPYLYFVNGNTGTDDGSGQKTEIKTGVTKGVWYEGQGDCMAIVTHKPEIKVDGTVYGAKVQSPTFNDMVFRRPDGIDYKEEGIAFSGTSGLIRKIGTRHELNIFHGSTIEYNGLSVSVSHDDLGVSAMFEETNELSGKSYTQKPGTLTIGWSGVRPLGHFYLDGIEQKIVEQSNLIKIEMPSGYHHWQFTSGKPVPMAPTIVRTENSYGSANLFFNTVAGATGYRVELSMDGGTTWKYIGDTQTSPYLIKGLKNGEKIHARVIAFNEQHKSEPANEYPIYVSDSVPNTPDGLRIESLKDATSLTWGEVLGASEYRLYRRRKGEEKYTLVYKGLDRSFRDRALGVIPSFEIPGEEGTVKHYKGAYTIYEYVVSAVNGNGESKPSLISDTDPASWRNWEPVPNERFRYRHNIGGEREGMRVIDASDSLPSDYIEL
jgi:hypothetical protein